MLLSIHVPKAAGNSFREALMRKFGARILRDYGDWAGFNVPFANERRHRREVEARARRDELARDYDVIHGHFIPDKYMGLFPVEDFIAFFREPCQQAIAHYHFLKRNPQRQHPEARIFHEADMTLEEYLEWDAFRDHQTQFLGSLSVEDLAFVGLSSEYARSLDLFARIFGCDLGPEIFENVNDERTAQEYEVAPHIEAMVKKYRARDVELYRFACEIFERQLSLVAA